MWSHLHCPIAQCSEKTVYLHARTKSQILSQVAITSSAFNDSQYGMATAVSQQRRNIVVLGKTGAGKSTVANQILGTNHFEVSTSTQSAGA